MSSNQEHAQTVKEYRDLVHTLEETDGKLLIVTFENETIITTFTSSGWIVDGDDSIYETIEQLLMKKSPRFGQLFHKALFDKLDAIASKNQ